MTWLAVKAFFGGAWNFLRGLPWPVWAGAALLAAGWYYGHVRFEAGLAAGYKDRDAVQALFTAHLQADKAAIAKARADAEADRVKRQNEAVAAKAVFEKEKADALAEKDRVIANLRAGTVRLRHEWQGCQAHSDSADAAGDSPGGSDADADLRNTGAGDLVRIGKQADAEVIYLQSLIRSAPACFKIE